MYYVHSNFKWAKRIEEGLNLFFPMSTYCILCGNLIDDSRKYSLCDFCIRKLSFGRLHINLKKEEEREGREKVLDSAIVCMKYGLMEREIGASLKYSKNTYISRIIAEIMYDRIMNDPEYSTDYLSSKYIIPVPISEKRKRERGFNQTEKIGKYLAKKIDVKMLSNVLVREKETLKLAGLNSMERKDNLKDAFTVKSDILNGESIILLDDFYTTGATAYEAAKTLKEAGVKEIHLLALASRNKYIVKDLD